MMTHYNMDWLLEKSDKGEKLTFLYFWGHTNKNNEQIGKFCLSQWYESDFTVDGLCYKTAEHWMMAHKALLFEDTESFEKIIESQTPHQAKEWGRVVKNFDEKLWNEKRSQIVKNGNIHKFGQKPLLKNYLLSTENQILVEASPVDAIWGIGLTKESAEINNLRAWRGLNLLGFALMETRDFLRENSY